MSHGRHMTSLLLGRQLHGGPVNHRPFVAEFCCDDGTVMNNPGLTGTPAFAAEFSKVYNDCKLLAIADEEGFVSVVDTACQLPTEMADEAGPNKPRAQWMAHRNAVFDICWCNDDTQMLTASGDQTVALWDTGHADLLASFRGHSGSVKTVSAMPHASAVFASGARDGALMVWDCRVGARLDAATGEQYHAPVITVHDAHAPSGKKHRRRTPLQGRTRPSVTSLTFLQGEGSQLATGGVDGVVKFWDLRQTAAGAADEAAPALALDRLCDAGVPPISQKQHGITSMVLHPQGTHLLVSLTGGHHFLYDPLRPQIGPTRWFGGHTVASFYVKAAWSPDGTHIISGSTDRNAYIWEVDAPDGASPYVLPGHEGEVTAVAWCPSDFHQICTTADDATLKVWNIQRRQPEEQADDGAARHPWIYPWQQQTQVAAAAAVAAAYGDVGQVPGSATPLAGGLSAREAAAAATPGGSTPWSASAAAVAGGGTGGSRSSTLLAALRSTAQTGGDRGGEQQENWVANLHSAAPVQQQQQGPADEPAEQQQPEGSGLAGAAPHSAVAPRAAPYMTPFASHAAGAAAAAAAAAGSPAAASSAGRTSGRPTARRIGDLLNAVPSTRRTAKQKTLTSFLRSPATAATAAAAGGGKDGGGFGEQGTSGKGIGRAAAAAVASSRDLPDVGGSGRRAGGTKRGGSGCFSPRGGSGCFSPLPGLGGSALPSPPNNKRLRTTFNAMGTGAQGAGPAVGNSSDAAGAPGVAAGGSSSSGGCAAASKQAGAAAAQLEPSPEQGGVAAALAAAAAVGSKLAGVPGGAAGGMHRQESGNENLDRLQLS